MEDDLRNSPLYVLMGWPLSEVRWVYRHTSRYNGIDKDDNESKQKWADVCDARHVLNTGKTQAVPLLTTKRYLRCWQSAILCSTSAMLTSKDKCKLLSNFAGTIIWDGATHTRPTNRPTKASPRTAHVWRSARVAEGDLGSCLSKGHLKWPFSLDYNRFKSFVDQSPQAIVYYFSSTKNQALAKVRLSGRAACVCFGPLVAHLCFCTSRADAGVLLHLREIPATQECRFREAADSPCRHVRAHDLFGGSERHVRLP